MTEKPNDTTNRTEPTTSSRRTLLGGAAGATASAWIGHSDALAAPHSRAPRSIDRSSAVQLGSGDHVQAVVSAHWMATEAGVEALLLGGTAADAAISIASVLSVVEPWFSCVLGGGTWGLYFEAATGEVTSLDGVGPVGSKATLADYRTRNGERGIHQANLPGAWDGWMLWLERYGLLSLGEVLAPAIRVARAGYPVSSEMAFWLERGAEEILGHPDTARIYAPEGTFPVAGDTITQFDLATTFEALVDAYDTATGGSRIDAIQAARDYYYRGPLAEAIVSVSDRENGYFTLDDFANFSAEIRESVSIDFGDGVAVHQNPPNSQGMTMLLALNILKGLELAGREPLDPDVVHMEVEALKLAFGDRHEFIGDPDRIEVPVAELLSDEHAAEQRLRIDMAQAMEWPTGSALTRMTPAHTSTLQIVDRDGNAATVTTSLGAQFFVIGNTGIHINERNQFLSVEDGNPNLFTPGFKVRHTSCPYMSIRNGRPYIIGGNTGVDTQPQAQTQQFVNAAVFGMTAQEAIDQPRFVSTAWPSTNFPYDVNNTLQLEEGFPDSLITELESRGHEIVVGEGIFGSAGMIIISEDGTTADVGSESRTSTSFGQVVETEA